MHALVAVDDFNTCASVSKMLTSIGLRAEWTTSGNEAILRTTFAKENHDEFQVYIIDWLMSDMNGIEVVRRIRKVIGEDKPIIILTAYDWSDIEAEKRSGRYRILRKALFLSELQDTLLASAGYSTAGEASLEDKAASFVGKHVLLVEDVELNKEVV